MGLREQLQAPHGAGGLRLVAGLGAAAVVLVGGAIVGGLAVRDDGGATSTALVSDAPGGGGNDTRGGRAAASEDGTATTAVDGGGSSTTAVGGTAPATATSGGGAGAGAGPGAARPGGAAGGAGGGGAPQPSAGDRTGVSAAEISWGVHAPITVNGAPLPIAEDPVNGIRAYTQWLNDNGGINGRKIKLNLVDDGYTVDYARRAADTLVNDQRNFFVSGTLGVDQIGVIATEARRRGVPYMAAGGYEAAFNQLKVFQIGSSYDTHAVNLAKFLAVEPKYKGKRIGVSALDSPYITPVVEVFKRAAQQAGVQVVATVTIQKPDQQTSYISQIQALKRARTEVLVPLQDPLSTSRIVAECRGQLCEWTYAFANFANDSDVSLALMQGDWTGVRGLSGGCSHVHPNADNPSMCAQMREAHRQWAAIRGEDDWQENGQSGAAGYNVVRIWVGAMRSLGADVTRERFAAALRDLDGYSDLVSGPITWRGTSNYAHGADKFVVLEGQSNLRYRQVVPGLMDHF